VAMVQVLTLVMLQV
jgi:hypothetical protein